MNHSVITWWHLLSISKVSLRCSILVIFCSQPAVRLCPVRIFNVQNVKFINSLKQKLIFIRIYIYKTCKNKLWNMIVIFEKINQNVLELFQVRGVYVLVQLYTNSSASILLLFWWKPHNFLKGHGSVTFSLFAKKYRSNIRLPGRKFQDAI